MYLLGVLLAALILGLSIGLHELGHLLPAKLFGVKVPEYMVNFGPTLWSTRRGETTYGIKAIPMGGYCKLLGMIPPRHAVGMAEPPATAGPPRGGGWSAVTEEALNQAEDELEPHEEHRAFYRLSTPKKLAVMAGGILMNLLLAIVFTTIGVAVWGKPEPVAGVGHMSECVAPRDKGTKDERCQGMPKTAAQQAQLQEGDRILSVDGQPMTSWDELTDKVRGSAGKPLDLVVRRGGTDQHVTVTPGRKPKLDEHGDYLRNPDGTPQLGDDGFLGVTPLVDHDKDVTQVPGLLWDTSVRGATMVARLPVLTYDLAKSWVTGEPRDPNGPMSVIGVGRAAGEVTGGSAGQDVSASDKASFFVQVMAGLNLTLFLFNLIPLLPFDGGHVAIALWEGLVRAWRRARGDTRTYYANVAKVLPYSYVVIAALVVMTIVLVAADLFNPVI